MGKEACLERMGGLDMAGSTETTLSALQARYDKLRMHIGALDGALVAFSGGVDSTLLLKVAHEALGDKAVAVTVDSCLVPRAELEDAKAFCAEEGIEHVVIEFDPLIDGAIASNPPNRCYACKKTIMTKMLEVAERHGLGHVLEGSNTDDAGDYRPGKQAIDELGIESPLLENGFSKDDIRLLAMSLGIECWDKPSAACLASRFPFGEPLTAERLAMVESAEEVVATGGFEQLRVRAHGDIARIEVPSDELADLLDFSGKADLPAKLRELGFKYVTLDLGGFKSGSMNATL